MLPLDCFGRHGSAQASTNGTPLSCESHAVEAGERGEAQAQLSYGPRFTQPGARGSMPPTDVCLTTFLYAIIETL